ncbi:MAG: hypothetical protein ACRDT6_11565 [Micromonosporaceae bacterium]
MSEVIDLAVIGEPNDDETDAARRTLAPHIELLDEPGILDGEEVGQDG